MEFEVSVSRKVFRAASGQMRTVLRDVAFGLRRGEVCALLGPSGCGKTTLFRIISGLDPDFEGRVDMPEPSRIGSLKRKHSSALVFRAPHQR